MATGRAVADRLDTLDGFVGRLMTAETEREICDLAVAAVPEVFDVQLAGLWLYDADASELQLTAATERADRLFEGEVVYRPGNSLSWEAFEKGELRTYNATDPDEGRYNADSSVDSELILPLDDQGVMNISSTEPNAFSPDDVRIGKLLATNVAAALRKTEREHALQVKNDRLEEFVGIVSHDLRNPLNVAEASLEAVRSTCDSEHVGGVAEGLDRIETLIDDLLTLAEQGYVVENRTKIDLASLAEEAWGNVHAPEATLEVVETASIFGDRARLLQAFENLFRNAVEHGGDDVTVQVKPLEAFHTSTRADAADELDGFYVADDGTGIPPGERGNVFDSGYTTGGTGLGLAIVERIVAAHGWEIEADEAATGGAKFTITGGTKAVSPFKTF